MPPGYTIGNIANEQAQAVIKMGNHIDPPLAAQQLLENAYRFEGDGEFEAALQACQAAIALAPG